MGLQPAPRKICVVTGSRADYGLLYFLMREILLNPRYELQVVVTGMHLSPEFGMTAELIEKDGFAISARIETLLSSDTGGGIAKSTGLGVLGFADALQSLRPDLMVVLGDRFEIFAAAQAAMFLRIPIAHIGGGDVTAGAFDEGMRHGISKLAHLHFVTNIDAVRRLTRMGENPIYIFNVGSPGLDHLIHTEIPDRATLEKELDFELRQQNFLVTFHPVTLDAVSSQLQLQALLDALDKWQDKAGVIITMPNADTEGRALIRQLRRYAEGKKWVKVFDSLGQRRYLAAVAHADLVIGNSSSGLYEAPSLRTPTVNIGRRQEGRLRAKSVFDCAPIAEEIFQTMTQALAFGRQPVENPYQQGDCAQLMMQAIDGIPDYSGLLLKRFYDGEASC